MLTRENILGTIRKTRIEKVLVPVWGGSVFVKELTAEELDHFESTFAEERQKAEKEKRPYKPNVRGRMMATCVCDENGGNLFQPEDADALSKFPAHEIEGVVNTCNQLNKFTRVHQEELEKKFETAGVTASPVDLDGNTDT